MSRSRASQPAFGTQVAIIAADVIISDIARAYSSILHIVLSSILSPSTSWYILCRSKRPENCATHDAQRKQFVVEGCIVHSGTKPGTEHFENINQ